jgi:2-polyprenyl-3-methyl-5-hydroxy-6-metoxy-1,4-benzoquinol methylase
METGPRTWHYGVVARWWAEFNLAGPEIAHFRQFVEGDGQPALDVACGTGRLLVPYLQAGLDVNGCDISEDTNPVASSCSTTRSRTPTPATGDTG